MRARKFIKITLISIATLVVIVLFLVAFFLFNPFEGDLPSMRGVVPRGVDFFVNKVRLAEDYSLPGGGTDTDRFPYVPALEEIGRTGHWRRLKKGSWYRDLGVAKSLRELRDEFTKLKTDASFIHLVDDILGTEVQIAGYFGDRGFEDAEWCLYTRVSWRGKAAFGAMAQSMVREEMSNQGLVLGDDEKGGFYTLHVKQGGLDLFLARVRDCVMVSNNRELLVDSLKLAEGGRQKEPLATSGHYKDGVSEPLEEWHQQTGVPMGNVSPLEWHLRPDQLFPKLPDLRGWPSSDNDENRNEKILASFLNLDSYRFLSGSVIFEPNSLTFLSHLVVNDNLLTDFQKQLFDAEATPRSEWMNDFFSMVPTTACAAAALKLPAGEFIREMFKDCLVSHERDEINRAIRMARKYKGMDDVIDKIGVFLQPRVGVVLQPNRRTDSMKETFPVNSESPFPQAAWVFWVKRHRRSNRVQNDALNDLVTHFNESRGAYSVRNAYKLGLSTAGVKSDVAYEFANPFIPGTGQLAMATVGEYFILSTSGPLIYSMVQSRDSGNSRVQQEDFQEFVKEMPPSINGAVFVWADRLQEVAQDFQQFASRLGGTMDQAWAFQNRPRVTDIVFKEQRWRRYGTKAKIPEAEKQTFESEVTAKLNEMWREVRAEQVVAGSEALEQFLDLTGTFRSAYLQMVLTDTSLRVWGRMLSPQYGR